MTLVVLLAAVWLLVSALLAVLLGRGLVGAESRRPERAWMNFCAQHGLDDPGQPEVVGGPAAER